MKARMQSLKFKLKMVLAVALGRPVASNVEVFGELHSSAPKAVIGNVKLHPSA